MDHDINPTMGPVRASRFPARLQPTTPPPAPTLLTATELQQKALAWLVITLLSLAVLALFALGNWIDRQRSPSQDELEAFAATAEAVAWTDGLLEGRRQGALYLDEQVKAAYELGLQHAAKPATGAASACRGGV